MNRALQAVFLIVALIAIGQPLWQHARLPQQVASHFDASGRADGWSSRAIQTSRYVAVVVFLAVIFPTLAWFITRHPGDCPGLPHPEYWLAPQRRNSTAQWLAGTVLAHGGLVLLFLIALRELTYRANLHDARVPAAGAVALLGGLFVAILALLGTVLIHFGRKPAG